MIFHEWINKPFPCNGKTIVLKTNDDADQIDRITQRLCLAELYSMTEDTKTLTEELDRFIEDHLCESSDRHDPF